MPDAAWNSHPWARRRPSRSHATSRPLLCISEARASAFPPAPAQASTTTWPGRASQASATNWLPSSCTSKRPALNARRAKTLVRPVNVTPQGENRVGSTRDPSVRRIASNSSRGFFRRFARTVSGARWFSAAASARVSAAPSCSLHNFASQRGSEVSAASASSGSSGTPSGSGRATSSSAHCHGPTSGPARPAALSADCRSPAIRYAA